jgi:hypothetical protein
MALENFSSGKKFLSIADGKLVQTFKEPTEGAKERLNKNSRMVYEIQHDYVIGEILSIAKKENDYGIFLLIDIKDGADIYQISTQFSGRYSSSFLKALPNIDLMNPVRLLPWSMIDKNDPSRKITGITLYQNDGNGWVKVLPYYTKESPNGLPEMVKVKIKGKESWDDTDMMDFLFAAGQNCFKITVNIPEGTDLNKPPF